LLPIGIENTLQKLAAIEFTGVMTGNAAGEPLKIFARITCLERLSHGQCRFDKCYSKGWRSTMVSTRSGPVEMMLIDAPTTSCRRCMYLRALTGNSSSDLAPTVLSLQPGISS